MAEEITKIDMNKYLVVKREDLNKYFSNYVSGVFITDKEQKFIDKIPFNVVLKEIQAMRECEGKKENRYLVLNMDDEIDIIEIRKALYNKNSMHENHVKDIAVDLVNAILKAKGD